MRAPCPVVAAAPQAAGASYNVRAAKAAAVNIARVAAQPPEVVEVQLALADAIAAAETAGAELVGSIARADAEAALRAARLRHQFALDALAAELFAVRENAMAQRQATALMTEQSAADGVRAAYLAAVLAGDEATADELEPLVPEHQRVPRNGGVR
ncbi:hypothetical protein [Anaeromyxobacter paludicola]|uniref:Outer membrane efflux protein n=1 Tax=Anaeromyxobacter paludicola TaxID=2918171 RepID=A0ABN6N6K5_9BACT|nr:hypothetical protein [Anaeromyxobacter paludicola]BDG07620.1 hypothetical protein AMPC_07330 [Anaeromyxobacter paludicola]